MADELVPVYHGFDMGNVSIIRNLPTPVDLTDAVRLQDLNGAIEGLAPKDDVHVATTANVNLSAPGATIDGVTLATNDRVLIKDQTNATENGLYIFNGAATPMTRAPDGTPGDELNSAIVAVTAGTTNAGTTFRQTTINPTLGVDNIVFTTFGSGVPDASTTTAGKIRIATQAEVNAGTVVDEVVTPATLASWTGAHKKITSPIGDGSALVYNVTHNLGTLGVVVDVYVTASGTKAMIDYERTNVNTIQFQSNRALTTDELTVVIIG